MNQDTLGMFYDTQNKSPYGFIFFTKKASVMALIRCKCFCSHSEYSESTYFFSCAVNHKVHVVVFHDLIKVSFYARQ